MTINNSLAVFISRRRWLKRRTLNILPNIAHKKILQGINFHYNPKDLRGPSFHFAYELEKGFLNYEETDKKELLDLVPKGGIFLDIGANIGLFSVYFSLQRKDIKVYCFEPDEATFVCLAKNTEQLKSREIKIFNKALGEKCGEEELHKSSINDGGHSFIKSMHTIEIFKEKPRDGGSKIVPMVTFDELVKTREVELPDVIKIDVEGYELGVIKGMSESISAKKPDMLIETSNSDLANKGSFWKHMTTLKDLGIFARQPGSLIKMNMEELAIAAKKNLDRNKLLSNYFFQFNS